jgi:hypothetical protein
VRSGCGRPVSAPTEEPASDPAAKEAPATPESAPADPEAAFSEAGDQTYLDPIALAKFTTKVMHIGDISKGHFNLYVEGGEPVAVRAWIGDEAATNVVVTKAEYEVDHHCAHLEVAQPMPEDARFWLEIETADGQRLKGSSPLK